MRPKCEVRACNLRVGQYWYDDGAGKYSTHIWHILETPQHDGQGGCKVVFAEWKVADREWRDSEVGMPFDGTIFSEVNELCESDLQMLGVTAYAKRRECDRLVWRDFGESRCVISLPPGDAGLPGDEPFTY